VNKPVKAKILSARTSNIGSGFVMFEKIRVLVGVDGSLQSKRALAEAITIVKHFSGFVKVVTVADKGSEEKAKAILSEVSRELENECVSYEVALVVGSDAAKVLENVAKQGNFDLIVVGSRGLGGGISMLLGSVSKKIVGNAYCNVLVVKSKR